MAETDEETSATFEDLCSSDYRELGSHIRGCVAMASLISDQQTVPIRLWVEKISRDLGT